MTTRLAARLALTAILLVNMLAVNFVFAPFASAATVAVDGTTGNDLTCTAGGTPCMTIQVAITKATPGDIITVAAGTYPEQIVIDKNLTITGAGSGTTTIQLPATPTTDGPGGSVVIVEVDGGAVVTMSGFTVAGPYTSAGCGDEFDGVFVVGGSTLNLSNSAVRDIRLANQTLFGCQNGYAINVGYGAISEVGTATLDNVTVSGYQKLGVFIDGPGSSATLTNSTIIGAGSQTQTAQNGVQVSDGATATISGNTISGHVCDLVGNIGDPVCGPGQISSPNQVQSYGIILFDAGSATVVSNNTISDNDGGLIAFSTGAPTGASISGNAFTANRFTGLILLDGTFTVAANDITGSSNTGIQVGTSLVATTATLTNNRIADTDRGVQIIDSTPADAFAATVSGSSNSLASNGIGVDNGTNTQADFRSNWWGSPTGPQAPNNPGGNGVAVVGNVLFTPFLTDGTDFSTARGFQPGTTGAGLSTSALAFGSQAVGSTSGAQSVTLTNTGSGNLTVSNVAVTGTNPGDFAITGNNCTGANLNPTAPGNSCTVSVAFTPQATGARVATLTFVDSASNSPQTVALSGTGTPAPTPPPTPAPTPTPTASPSPAPTFTVTATKTGNGTINPSGTSSYTTGTLATYTASAATGQVFLGWTLDGEYVGYAPTLNFTVTSNRTLAAQFVARPSFGDIGALPADEQQAITFLAALGIVNPAGVNGSGNVEPNRQVARAEMAAFVARVFGWQKEFHANTFPDKCDPANPNNCIDDELWNNVAALKDYGVVGGYNDPGTCQSGGTTAPCYLPRDTVQRVQVVSIVARAFIKQPDLRPTGFWDRLDADPNQYTNVPNTGTQRSDLTTYLANVGAIPDQAGTSSFNDPNGGGLRRFVLQVLYAAFNSQYGVDRVP